jgi:hypothetical protein
MPATLRFASLIQTVASNIEQPTVIATTNATFLHSPVVKRGSPMHTARVEQARTAALVPEQHQVFSQ